MSNKCCPPAKTKQFHPIDSFGISRVSLSAIRADRLEDRVVPKIPFPHRHDFYQFILITKGSGNHQIDFKDYKVQSNQLFLLKPGQIHSWSLSQNISGYVIEFNRDSLALGHHDTPDLINHINFTDDVLLLKKDRDFQRLKNIVQLMLQESQNNDSLFDVSLKGYLTILLIEIFRKTNSFSSNQVKVNSLEKFRNLVEKNYRSEHRVEFYAKELGVSAKSLTMQISRLLGRSPRDLIQERLLLEAKRYLAYSDLSVAEIGYEIGFDDANYFSRFFKKHVEMTPAKFKASLR